MSGYGRGRIKIEETVRGCGPTRLISMPRGTHYYTPDYDTIRDVIRTSSPRSKRTDRENVKITYPWLMVFALARRTGENNEKLLDRCRIGVRRRRLYARAPAQLPCRCTRWVSRRITDESGFFFCRRRMPRELVEFDDRQSTFISADEYPKCDPV